MLTVWQCAVHSFSCPLVCAYFVCDSLNRVWKTLMLLHVMMWLSCYIMLKRCVMLPGVADIDYKTSPVV